MLRAAVPLFVAAGAAAQNVVLPPHNPAAAAHNPLKGMLTSPDWSAPPYLDSLPSGLEFFYVGIDDVMESMTSFEGMDTYLEPRIAATASRDKHSVIRLMLDYPNRPLPNDVPQFLIDEGLTMTPYEDFGGGLSPDYSSPQLIAALEAVIAELGSRYDGDPRVGFVQIGLLGFWGEWHTWPYEWIPAETKDAVIAAFSTAFTHTQIQVRVPWASAIEAGGVLGLHDDSFAYSTLDGDADGGGETPWYFWPSLVNHSPPADTVWRTGAMGGELRPELQETIFNDDYPTGTHGHQDFVRCVEETHATYMLNFKGYAPDFGYTGSALARARAASDRMGYAFIVTDVEQVDIQMMPAIRVTVQQKGVAPFYYALSLTISCEGYTASLPGVEDIIAEGDEQVFTFENVPSSTACLAQVTIALDSPMAYPDKPVVFAQGDDGTVVINLTDQPPPPPPAPLSPGLEHEGEGCWTGCGGQQGYCDWCGTGVCCRQGQWSGQWPGDLSTGCDGYLGGAEGHICVAAPPPPPLPEGLQHEGESCWVGCSQEQGYCDWCGTGLCCRQNFWSGQFDGDTSTGCDGYLGGAESHICVAAPPPPPPPPPPPCQEWCAGHPDGLQLVCEGWGVDQCGGCPECDSLGTEPAPPSPAPYPAGMDSGAGLEVTPVVTSIASLPGGEYATYRLSATLGQFAESLYAIHGTPDAVGVEEAVFLSGVPGPMILPPAFQVATPFGTDIGGVSPVIVDAQSEAAFDSWLTVGLSEGDSGGALSSVGIDFASWTATSGLEVADGAVFVMEPSTFEAGTGDDVLVAQLTVAAGVSTTVQMGMQGRMVGEATQDWRVDGVSFEIVSATAPAPAPALACEGWCAGHEDGLLMVCQGWGVDSCGGCPECDSLGTEPTSPAPAPPVEVTPVVTSIASLPGGEYATYRLSATLSEFAESLYAIHGTPEAECGRHDALRCAGTNDLAAGLPSRHTVRH